MRVHLLERQQRVRAPLERVFAFLSEARNLERITPEWLSFQMQTPEPIEIIRSLRPVGATEKALPCRLSRDGGD